MREGSPYEWKAVAMNGSQVGRGKFSVILFTVRRVTRSSSLALSRKRAVAMATVPEESYKGLTSSATSGETELCDNRH